MTFILSKGSKLLRCSNFFLSWICRQHSSHSQLRCLFSSLPELRYPLKSIASTYSKCGTQNSSLRNFHTSYSNNGNRKSKREKKPIVYNKKVKFIDIWRNMTVKELATNLNKTEDGVFEAFLHVPGSENYDSPSSIMNDLKVIQMTVKICGLRYNIIPSPKEPDYSTPVQDAVKSPPAPPEELESRPPIVTIMGHVDHGKTTLLDTLRQSSIVDTEFGGITQHIGAFEVSLSSGSQVTFLDTPGHAAFSAMRARGANVTDIIVLVVAADDGVLPQTEEVIALAKDARIPLIVAINKVDKPEANIEQCKAMLLNAGLQLEEQGGDIQAVEISALKGTNIDLLVESLVMQAELLNLRATKKGLIEGTVLETRLDPQRGKVTTCLVHRGTLSKGAYLVAETFWAKVRNLFDFSGKPIEKALPGVPVQVIGWRDGLPTAGAELLEVSNERRAKEVVDLREGINKQMKSEVDLKVIQTKVEEHYQTYRAELLKKRAKGIKFKLYRNRPPLEKMIKEDNHPRVYFVLKGDVNGSVEAILDVIDTYHSEEASLEVLGYGVGCVTPSDIEMAKAFKGSIYAFNLSIPKDIMQMARHSQVPVKQHNVIYRLIENLKDDLTEILPPKLVEETIGEATVQEEFLISERRKKIPVAGSRCTTGQIIKGSCAKVIRTADVIHEGKILSMRHMKKEVGTIRKDTECGIRFEDTECRFQPGDIIVCFKTVEEKQKTDWRPDGF